MTSPAAVAPPYGADIYDDQSLLEPYEHYRALRDVGSRAFGTVVETGT